MPPHYASEAMAGRYPDGTPFPPMSQVSAFDGNERLWNPHTHTHNMVVLPWGEPGCLWPFANWNDSFERFLVDAYHPSQPVWVQDDTFLADYLNDRWTTSRNFHRGKCVSQASRISTAIWFDNFIGRWKALDQKRRRELLLERFEADAQQAHDYRNPDGRLYTPELTLSNLLRDDGQGFIELAESLCYSRSQANQDIGAEKFPTVPHASWEKVVGVPPPGVTPSRLRRAYVETMFLMRHMALFRLLTEFRLPWYEQEMHWKTGHKRICGKKLGEIPLEASFPSSSSFHLTPGLTETRNRLLEPEHKDKFWTAYSSEGSFALAPNPTMFPPGKFDEAIAEFRQLAFRAFEKPDPFDIGIIALVIESLIAPAFREEQQRLLIRDFQLGKADSEDGAAVLERNKALAREQLKGEKGKEHPWIKHYLDDVLPDEQEEKTAVRAPSMVFFAPPPPDPAVPNTSEEKLRQSLETLDLD
ncbi:hypothetical protein JCM8097_002301 [Rhodosporidiobolus ruineniae]